MTEVFILYSFNALPNIYKDKMRAEGPNQYPYTLGLALNEYLINTEALHLFMISTNQRPDDQTYLC